MNVNSHVLVLLEASTKNLIDFLPGMRVKSIDSMAGLIKFTYPFAGGFDPSVLWANDRAIAPIDERLFTTLIIGDSVEFIKTRKVMPFIINNLSYFGFEIENLGPRLQDNSGQVNVELPYVTITCRFDRDGLEVYFLGE